MKKTDEDTASEKNISKIGPSSDPENTQSKDRMRQRRESAIVFCKKYAEATQIPVTLREEKKVLYNSQAETMDIPAIPNEQNAIYNPHRDHPEFCGVHDNYMFAKIPILDTMMDIFLGPVFQYGVDQSVLHSIMVLQSVPLSHRSDLFDYLNSIPPMTRDQLGRHVILIHQVFNHKDITIPELFRLSGQDSSAVSADYHRISYEDQLDVISKNNLRFEKQLYWRVSQGNLPLLDRFLNSYSFPQTEPSMARSEPRNSKDQFMAFAAKLGIEAGIPAGIAPEKVNRFISLYCRQCESLQTVDEIIALRNSMIYSLCVQAASQKIPKDISSDTAYILSFIRSHVYEPVNIDDIAAAIGKSRSFVIRRCKEELGINVGAFIMRCRLEEARSLLTWTDRSLSEISNILCFSSQSYFQNVFKKKYGITPLEYRKKSQKEISSMSDESDKEDQN